jgi:hypothetical protein
MRLDEKGLEQPLIRFNLTLEFLILLRPQSWLVGIRNDVIEIDFRAIGAQDRAVEATLLQPYDVWAVSGCVMFGHSSDSSRITSVSGAVPIMRLISLVSSAGTF